MARVKIKKLPQALSGLEVKMQPGLYGTNGNRQFTLPTQVDSQKFSQQPTEVRKSLTAVPRDEANLEAEGGETAIVNIDGMPAHFDIKGKRHSKGGVPLNLPDNSFIFSDTAKMKIKDPVIQKEFGLPIKKGGYTPAEIAKKYDVNKFRKILADPNSEDLERKTAEAMIANYNIKLAKLALVQESIKGLPQGIPVIAMPYMIANNVDPAMYMPTQGQEEQPDEDMGVQRYGGNIVSQYPTMRYGGLPMAQTGVSTDPYGFSKTNAAIERYLTNKRNVETTKKKDEEYKKYNKFVDNADKELFYTKQAIDLGLKSIAQQYNEQINFILSDKGITESEKIEKIDRLRKLTNYHKDKYINLKTKLDKPGTSISSKDFPVQLPVNPSKVIKSHAVMSNIYNKQNPANFKNDPQFSSMIKQSMGIVDPNTFQPIKYPMMPTPIPGGEKIVVDNLPVEEDITIEQTTKPTTTKNVEVKKKPEVKTQTKSKSSSFLDDYKDYL